MAAATAADPEARRAYIEAWQAKERADIAAESAQIALEESVLDEAVKEDPSLEPAIELQRRDIGARKKTLAARSDLTGRLPSEE